MEIMRTYKFRLKPTQEQLLVLEKVCAAVRVVYNAANEQRLLYSRKKGTDFHGRDSYFHKYGQIKEVGHRTLKKDPELLWITDAPAIAMVYAMEDLQQAWDKVLSERAKGMKTNDPSFRSASTDNSFRMPVWTKSANRQTPNVLFGKDFVRLPKIGYIKYIKHRKMKGQFKTATVKKEGSRWYIIVSAKITVKDPCERPANYVGIDLGTSTPIALSDGTEFEFVKTSKKEKDRQKKLQRQLSRAKKGSKRRKVVREKLASMRRKEAARKNSQLQKITTQLVREFTHISREDLSVKKMTQSAKSRRKSGKKTADNKTQAAFNRAFLEVPKYAFGAMLDYKAPQYGTEIMVVDPAYTSQKCSACGNVSKNSRVSQDTYVCTSCGHTEHADTNAAKNILKSAFPNAILNTTGERSDPLKTPSEERKSKGHALLQTSATSKSVASLTEGRIGSHFQNIQSGGNLEVSDTYDPIS